MRSTCDPDRVRTDLLRAAERLADQGVLLLTVRLHDHSRVLRLPYFLARPMRQRIEILNETYDHFNQRFSASRST